MYILFCTCIHPIEYERYMGFVQSGLIMDSFNNITAHGDFFYPGLNNHNTGMK